MLPESSRPLRETDEPRVGPEIRALEPSDEAAALRALMRVFELEDENPLLKPGAWSHRYFVNPAGTRATVAVDERGEVLAQYAGLPQRAWVDDEETVFTQGVDSLADPTRGRGLGSLFVRVGERFAEDHGGRLGEGDVFMWGYPVRAAWRVGRARLGYETIRSQVALVLDARTKPELFDVASEVREYATAHDLPPTFDDWFASRRRRYRAICDRSRERLAWRYHDAVARDDHLALARRAGAITGLAVGRTLEFEGAKRFVLTEWLVDDDGRDALVEWAAATAREVGATEVYTWLPPWCGDFTALQHRGFRVRPTTRVLVGRSYDKRFPAEWFAANWYTTLGDTDLA